MIRKYLIPIFLCLLLAQYAFILKFTEPYPAIILPGFGSVPAENGIVKIEDYSFSFTNENGMIRVVDKTDLFPQIFEWHINPSIKFLLLDTSGLMPHGNFRNQVITRRKSNELQMPAFKTYLKQRMATITGINGWAVFTITVTEKRFNTNSRSAAESTLLNIIHIPL